MTKDELDKYLAHLPARKTRQGGTRPSTAPPTCPQNSKAPTQCNQSSRSSFGVRGPRGLSKPTANLPQRTGTGGKFGNDDGTNDYGDSNKYGPTTKDTIGSNITTLMNSINLDESNNISSSSSAIPSPRAAGVNSTDTPMDDWKIANNGKHELESSNTTIQQPKEQPSKADTMPPIPTFSFGGGNTNNDDPMPPIPTFSFGDDDQQKNDKDDDNLLNLALGLRCGGCDKLISGMAITAAGHRWHADCFKCQHCHQDLEHVAFYEKDGLPYCALDYHELFTTRCQYCHTPIEEKSIHALGKYYHVGHFFCRECGKPFDEDSTFMEHNGYPYCEKDYLAKFAHKCKGCKEDITNDFLEALDGKWHITCFVCVDCGRAFESNTFYVRNNLPYCERHSRRIVK